MGYRKIARMKIQISEQLDLTAQNGTVYIRPRANQSVRRPKPAPWFGCVQRVVARALGRRPIPPARPEQIWLLEGFGQTGPSVSPRLVERFCVRIRTGGRKDLQTDLKREFTC